MEREINLKDLFITIMLRWRIFVVMVVAAVLLLGCFSYVNSVRASKVRQAEIEQQEQVAYEAEVAYQEALESLKNSEVAQKSLSELEAVLTEAQKAAIKSLMLHEAWYEDKLTYVEQSYYQQLDPNNIYQGEVTFVFTSGSIEDTYKIERIYEDLVTSGEMYEAVGEALGLSSKSVAEIVKLKRSADDDKERDTLRMYVYCQSEEHSRLAVAAMIDYVNAQYEELQEQLEEYEVSVVNDSYSTVTDANVFNNQVNVRSTINNYQATIANYLDGLTKEGMQYYCLLADKPFPTEKYPFQAPAQEPTSAESEEGKPLEPIIPGVNWKLAILGAFALVFVYAGIIFLQCLFINRILFCDDLQNIYGVAEFGKVRKEARTKKCPFSFVDEWLLSLRDYGKRKFTEQETVDLAASAIKVSAGKIDVDTVYFVGIDLQEKALQICENVKAQLQERGIQAKVLSNVLYDAESMEAIADAKAVVLVEQSGVTYYNEFEQELELLKRQEIPALGYILVE